MELTSAQQLAWGWVVPKGTEWLSLPHCLGRVLAETLLAEADVPGEFRSRMDGFAIRSAGSQGASAENPISLKVVPEMGAAGHWTDTTLGSDECLRILTGAPLPRGGDAVVAREDACERDGQVMFAHEVPAGQWLTAPGDDVRSGEVVLPAGVLLTATRLALAAALGHAWLPVVRRPEVALLATGDELLELGAPSARPSSYCNNRHLLALLISQQGGAVTHLGIGRDHPQAITEHLAPAQTDLVITTGGIGHGERDFVLQAWDALGVTVHWRQVNLSPGKNSALGTKDRQIYAALPGNPWAAQVVFVEILAPLLRRWQGLALEEPLAVNAILTDEVRNRSEYHKAVRGELELRQGQLHFRPMAGAHGSLFSQLRRSTAYALVPPVTTALPPGAQVAVRCPDLPLEVLSLLTAEPSLAHPP
jgi:molybdopterin molybdotransferase